MAGPAVRRVPNPVEPARLPEVESLATMGAEPGWFLLRGALALLLGGGGMLALRRRAHRE